MKIEKFNHNVKVLTEIMNENNVEEYQKDSLSVLMDINEQLFKFFNNAINYHRFNIKIVKRALDYYLDIKQELGDGVWFENDPLGFDVEDIQTMGTLGEDSFADLETVCELLGNKLVKNNVVENLNKLSGSRWNIGSHIRSMVMAQKVNYFPNKRLEDSLDFLLKSSFERLPENADNAVNIICDFYELDMLEDLKCSNSNCIEEWYEYEWFRDKKENIIEKRA